MHIFHFIAISLGCLWFPVTENLTQIGLDIEGHFLPHVTENSRDWLNFLYNLINVSVLFLCNFPLALFSTS